MSDRCQSAARRRGGTQYGSLCFIMHNPQSNMTYLLASSLYWQPDEDSRWASTLHELSSFHQVTADPTASSRHFRFRDRQPRHTRHPHLRIHWRAQEMPLLDCEGVTAIAHS